MEQQVKEFGSLIELLEEWKESGVSPQEISHRMQQYIEYKARTQGIPIRGTLELTPLCNLGCKMCYVYLNRDQLEHSPRRLMTGDQWIQIIQQAIDMGLLEVTLTGGEALLYPDFESVLSFLSGKNIRVKLKSNGILLTEERIAFLKFHHLSGIQISLYGSNEDSYEKVTGVRAFKLTMNAIERVRRAQIPLEIVITPSVYMWDDMESIIRLVSSLGIEYSVNPGLIKPFEETGRADQHHDLTIEQYIELSKMRAEIRGVKLVPACSDEQLSFGGNHQEDVVGLRCAAGRSVFSVTWDGRVLPCRAIEKIGFDGLTTSFSKGWKMLNDTVQSYPYPRECVGCEFEGICPSCVVQHETGAELGHANKAICYRAKRMVEEGFIRRNT